jgi:hypothetical protein
MDGWITRNSIHFVAYSTPADGAMLLNALCSRPTIQQSFPPDFPGSK